MEQIYSVKPIVIRAVYTSIANGGSYAQNQRSKNLAAGD
jgi:hypothetical protein